MVRFGDSVPVRLQDQVGLVNIHKEGAEDQDQPDDQTCIEMSSLLDFLP